MKEKFALCLAIGGGAGSYKRNEMTSFSWF